MRPIKATRPRSNLSAAITRGFRDGRILPAGFTAVRGIPVPLPLPAAATAAAAARTTSWKVPEMPIFPIGLSAE
jgi:hypothetical protein